MFIRFFYQVLYLRFRVNLANITDTINLRNEAIIAANQNNQDQVQEYPYKWLLPHNVLNSISI